MMEDIKFDPVAKRKGHPEDFLHLTKQDCAAMPDDEFRRTFIAIVNDLIGDFGLHTLADELPFVVQPFEDLTTDHMRELVFTNQEWFNGKSI